MEHLRKASRRAFDIVAAAVEVERVGQVHRGDTLWPRSNVEHFVLEDDREHFLARRLRKIPFFGAVVVVLRVDLFNVRSRDAQAHRVGVADPVRHFRIDVCSQQQLVFVKPQFPPQACQVPVEFADAIVSGTPPHVRVPAVGHEEIAGRARSAWQDRWALGQRQHQRRTILFHPAALHQTG